VDEFVCKELREKLANLRAPDDLAAVPNEFSEEQIVEGRHVTFVTYKIGIRSGETLVVCQAFVHSWSRPTYLSLGAIGRLYAEGLLVKDGRFEPAPDELMWQFR
jgi:hypothetical protein